MLEGSRRKQYFAVKDVAAVGCYFWLQLFILWPSCVVCNVAYPGIWTARQPSGQLTGTEQVLVGTAISFCSR